MKRGWLAVLLLLSPDLWADCAFGPGSHIALRVSYSPSCQRYRPELDAQVQAAVERLQSCMAFGFVSQEIAKKMVDTLEGQPAIRVRCEEPLRQTWCAAAGWGEIWLSPSRMLERGSFCHADLGAYFVHEVGHLADLSKGPGHDEQGETGFKDEVYSLQNYCMRPARNWIRRATRTADVVDPTKLKCVRAYQELTPSTLRDPFWDDYRHRMESGFDPCANPPKTPSF